MEKKSAIKRAVKLLNDPRTMVGHVPEILIKTGIFDRKDIKKVLDELDVTDTKQRKWIYEQMKMINERVKQARLKKVV